MRCLILSAYDAVSHRSWRRTLAARLPGVDCHVLALPPRKFAWRFKGHPLWWTERERAVLEAPWDLVIATSMVDLATLRGLVPALARCPTLLYFHENQVAYPTRDRIDAGWIVQQLFAASCADHVAFNSAYNRDSWADGTRQMLRKIGDHAPLTSIDRILAHSTVLPVPLDDDLFVEAKAPTGPLRVLWNHRWEYDKGPSVLFRALEQLEELGIPFRADICGQQFRHVPPAFEAGRQRLGAHITTWGYVEGREAYLETLGNADVVLSTALHDFQGLAVQEAMARGARPLVPDRLAYREYTDAEHRYPSTPDQPAAEGDVIARRLADLASDLEAVRASRKSRLTHLAASALIPQYHELITSISRRAVRDV